MVLIWKFIWKIKFEKFQRQNVNIHFDNLYSEHRCIDVTFEVFDLHVNFDESVLDSCLII